MQLKRIPVGNLTMPNKGEPCDDGLRAENDRLKKEIANLRERVELFKGIFECLPDALVIADENREIQLTNPGFSKVFGYENRELTGSKTVVLYENSEEYEDQGRQRFNNTAEKQLAPYYLGYRRKDGSLFTGETTGTSLRDGFGNLFGYIGVIRDVSEREHARRVLMENENLLRMIANSIPELVVYIDRDQILKFVNATAEAWYNRPREELIGKPIWTVFTEESRSIVTPWIEKALLGQNVRERANITYPDGQCRSVELSYVPDFGPQGEVRGFVALVIDMTKQVNTEAELEQSKAMLFDAISAIPDGFAYYDSDDRLQVFNQKYVDIYSRTADLIQTGKTFEEIIRGGVERGEYAEARGREEEWIQSRLNAHNNPVKSIEQRLENGRWLRIEERKTRDGGTVGIRIDITEAKEREIQLEEMTVTDPLTGISNRRYFVERVQQEYEKIARYSGIMSVLIIDADHFKQINDTHGHSAGDHVLKELATILANQLRTPDVVSRYGGEEFAIFLTETSLGGAFSIANRIREAVETHEFIHDGTTVPVTVSIGCSQSDKRDSRYEDVIDRADRALYKAKEAGRNQVIVETFEEMEVENDLKR